MGFITVRFWLFLLAVLIFYAVAPQKVRWLVLLAASYAFYALWQWEYVGFLAGVTLVSYFAAIKLAAAPTQSMRRIWLWIGLAVALLGLFVFKYFDYSLAVLQSYLSPAFKSIGFLDLAAPLGISFFTLQVYSYLVDVYRGQLPAEKHLGKYALFVSFFPQMVAGPINRANKMLPQLDELKQLHYDDLSVGFFRILWGGVQKYAIADRLSGIFDQITGGTDLPGGIEALGSLYLFSILLYFDFAGYSNIALGVARLFGVRLAENFNQPYLALDSGDFWNRWHISLSNWLRDYIFYPVMRWLRGTIKNPRNLLPIVLPPLAAMLVSGIWHGTGMNFILWGVIHGGLLALSAGTARWRTSLRARNGKPGRLIFNAAQWLVTFTAVSLAWAFFTMPAGMAMDYLIGIFTESGQPVIGSVSSSILGLSILLFVLMEFFRWRVKDFDRILAMPMAMRWGITYSLIFLLLWMGDFASSQPFLYQLF